MKTRLLLSALVLVLGFTVYAQQEIKVRSTSVDVDYTTVKVVLPTITWVTPDKEESMSGVNKVPIKVLIESTSPLKTISFSVKQEGDVNASSVGSASIVPKPSEKFKITVDKQLTLLDGNNIIELNVENESGGKLTSQRKIVAGTAAVAEAVSNGRKDYAILFASDNYDNWNPLNNPIFDANTIKDELEKYYGFAVDFVKNPTSEEILLKIREYAQREYGPSDQLFIFFAGHGYFDDTFKEGYVVCKNSLLPQKDKSFNSYLSHVRLRNNINSIPCSHILLTMDVCFGGTFDPVLASSRGQEEEYEDVTRAEFISRKLQYKTRRYITSGGKTYVSDGIQGKHSPFARKILEALRTYGGKDGIVTTDELKVHLGGLKNEPRYGEFGDNEPGSDFVFVAAKK